MTSAALRIFVAAGPGIQSDAEIAPNAVDVAPTILELLGYRAPEMEGTVPAGLLVEGVEPSTVTDIGKCTYFTEEAAGSTETVTDRLEQLGYLE